MQNHIHFGECDFLRLIIKVVNNEYERNASI